MEVFVILSIILPIMAGFAIYMAKSDRITSMLSYIMLPVLSIMAYLVYQADLPMLVETPSVFNFLVTIFDFGLLAYFFWVGYSRKSILVSLLAIAQFILLLVVLSIAPHSDTANIYVDKLTAMMYLLVGIVGVPVAIFSTRYMDYNEKDKHKFVAIVIGFLGVMNFAVSANNVEWFFALFETTTLASLVLIGFRKDEVAINNSTLALWMNQIGGVAILFAIILMIKDFGVYHFTDLLAMDPAKMSMAAFGFLSIAALIKGAQLPFHKWLLGAMVAPTPVSAILHSATMVKIAPFLILRISPIIHNTLLSKLLILTTGFVFVAAAVFALTQDNFKRILAYSTISLLGLMMLAAAVGTPTAVAVSIMLIIFHGFAKGFLFVEAGILEKLYHVKYIKDMNRLFERAPLTLMFIFFGFLNMTFIPFGTFIGKWLMIEEASNFLSSGGFVMLILLVTTGGVFLSVLYIKVLGVAIKHHRFSKIDFTPMDRNFLTVSVWYYLWLVGTTIFIAPFIGYFIMDIVTPIAGSTDIYADGLSLVVGDSTLYFWQIIGALVLLLIIHLAPLFVKLKVDQTHPYNCGEIYPREAESYDFNFISKYEEKINVFAVTLFLLVLVLGGQLL
ncbi:MAG: hydrogenase [Hydrogenimonas sp.]|nr:MAG: hydrogenase [Hydrogenimonas sp.]